MSLKLLWSYFSLAAILTLFACKNQTEEKETMAISYPDTRKDSSIVDDYFGTKVADPYRWLEDDQAPEVEEWVKKQNELTFGYLKKIPFREEIRSRYEELFNYPKVSAPARAGEYFFYYKNDGLQNQPVIYVQHGAQAEPEVFIDPNALSKEGTISINLIGFSTDNKYVAISRQEAGSDWQEIRVMEIATKKELPDRLEWVKFSGAAWWKDGFFYSRYPKPKAGEELKGDNKYHSIYYHKLGTPQSEDQLIYRDEENPNIYHFGYVTEDDRYFIMYKQPGTDGFATYYKDLQTNGPFVKLFGGYDHKSSVIHNLGHKFLVRTNIDAPNYRLVEVDITRPEPENWKDIIPESENLLESVSTGGGKLFASYLENATNRIYQMEYDGSGRKEIQLPGLGSAGGFSGKEEEKQLFYSFSSFIQPNSIFEYDIESGKSKLFYRAELKFDPDDYTEKQVFYTSKDGTKVSMFIVHKKDIELNGQNPTYLYGYGGFNISLSPWFSASRIVFMERGGIFAMPNLRGGGEYGEAWHRAGMLDKKQNVFDDFIAAAEYLIDQKYTSSEKLAIGGGSNGGLLVGAAMTQRPDLFAVALPQVGVLDMLRYHKFTVGKGWIPEYGCADSTRTEFEYLYAYSPYHRLKEGTCYPATMILTGDHDDRVVPAHSFKFAARLQEVQSCSKPVLIRIETDAGHGAGKPTSKIIEEQADLWSFLFYQVQ